MITGRSFCIPPRAPFVVKQSHDCQSNDYTLGLKVKDREHSFGLTSMKSSLLSPAFSARVSPSANEAIKVPMTMLTTSFMLAPLPTCEGHPVSGLASDLILVLKRANSFPRAPGQRILTFHGKSWREASMDHVPGLQLQSDDYPLFSPPL